VPVLAVKKRLDFARDYLARPRETEGRFGERVETIDQKVELPSFAEGHGGNPVDECEVGTLRSLG